MRVIKLAIISAVILFLVITGISLLLPSQMIISRAIDINAPVDSVYANVADLANWQKWYGGTDTSKALLSALTYGEGASMRIDNTTIVIREASRRKINTFWIRGVNNKMLPGDFTFITGNEASHVTLQWQFVLFVNWYPWEKFASIVSNRTIGSFMERSLDKLKEVTEPK